jgi:Tol biopolymer transport system component
VDGWKNGESLSQARILIVNLATGAVEDLGPGAMPSWSDDGQWIAFCRYNPHSIFIRSLETGQEHLVTQGGWGVQWSPEGTRLAYTRGGNLVIYDLTTDVTSEILLSETYSLIYWNCRWSPDGREICFRGQRKTSGANEIAIVTLGETPQVRVQCDATYFNPDIAWEPNAARITVPRRSTPGNPGQIYVFDAHSSEDPVRLEGQPVDRDNSGMCWTRDGKTLYFLSRK